MLLHISSNMLPMLGSGAKTIPAVRLYAGSFLSGMGMIAAAIGKVIGGHEDAFPKLLSLQRRLYLHFCRGWFDWIGLAADDLLKEICKRLCWLVETPTRCTRICQNLQVIIT